MNYTTLKAGLAGLAMVLSSGLVQAEDSRHQLNPNPTTQQRQCYHSGDGFCRSQMQKKARAQFVAKVEAEQAKAKARQEAEACEQLLAEARTPKSNSVTASR